MAVSGGSIDNAVAFSKEKLCHKFNQSRKVLSSTVFPRIANDPTHPWLRSSRANKGPLPEWERQRTNNLTARR